MSSSESEQCNTTSCCKEGRAKQLSTACESFWSSQRMVCPVAGEVAQFWLNMFVSSGPLHRASSHLKYEPVLATAVASAGTRLYLPIL